MFQILIYNPFKNYTYLIFNFFSENTILFIFLSLYIFENYPSQKEKIGKLVSLTFTILLSILSLVLIIDVISKICQKC